MLVRKDCSLCQLVQIYNYVYCYGLLLLLFDGSRKVYLRLCQFLYLKSLISISNTFIPLPTLELYIAEFLMYLTILCPVNISWYRQIYGKSFNMSLLNPYKQCRISL